MNNRRGFRSLMLGSIATLTLIVTSATFAQNGPPPGAGGAGGTGGAGGAGGGPGQPGQPGQPGGPGGGRGGNGGAGGSAGQGAPDPQQFIDRLMANDANGDGKLSKDEVPGGLGERLFEQGDANKDGFLTPDELKAVASRQGGPGGGPGGRQGGGQQVSFGGYMNQAGRGMRGLERSKFDEASRENDLQSISAIEVGLTGAKSRMQTVPMSPKATEKFGGDEAAYRKAMRKHLMTTIYAALELETALVEGNSEAAQKCFGKLKELEDAGHELFAPPEEERGPGQPPQPAPAAPPAGGGGARGGNGGGN